VASAGNDGTQRPVWPAAFKRVVGVAALGPDGERAPFSNFGWWVDACSTGVDVDSCFFDFVGSIEAIRSHASPPDVSTGDVEKFEGFALWDGTSFAAPRVAAAIACAMSLGLDGPEAVYRLIGAPATTRKLDLGAVVEPPSFV
jgi:subtilisin family serine protease